MRSVRVVLFVAIATLCGGPLRAVGQCTLYGSDAADEFRNLWLIDPARGFGQVVGDMGAEITGIAFHPFTGVLYGVTATIQLPPQNFSPGDLVTIDPLTGVATLVGSLGLDDLSDEGPTLADIAFDPTTGVLYGWRARRSGDLYTVDLETGAATLVGESGLSNTNGQGLTFGPGGKLYYAGEGTQGLLRTIDKNTGLPNGSVQLTGYAGNENIPALAFDGQTIFGVAGTGGDLITINPVTGVITTIGPIASGDVPGNSIDGIAFACPRRPSSVPAMSAVGLACLAAALLALGAYAVALRARRRQAS
jgi:Repeat of unknown function (DUF6923)